MQKHLIIHGDCESGKSLFIKNLLSPNKIDKTEIVRCRSPKSLKDNFLWTVGDLRPEIIWFKDVNMSIHPEEFYPFTHEFKVNAQNQPLFSIEPLLIIEYMADLQKTPKVSSFTRRFDVINTNKDSYKDIMLYLKSFNKRLL